MLKINLWDNTFSHLKRELGDYSMVHDRVPSNIRYVSRKTRFDGITIFTDNFLNPVYINSVKSTHKVGWLIERAELNPIPKLQAESYINSLDFLMTNDQELLNKFPNKTRFVPFGGSWVKEKNQKLYPKSKEISMIYSHKKGRLAGYGLRHAIAKKHVDKIDLFGNGSPNPIKFKEGRGS